MSENEYSSITITVITASPFQLSAGDTVSDSPLIVVITFTVSLDAENVIEVDMMDSADNVKSKSPSSVIVVSEISAITGFGVSSNNIVS